MSKTHPALASLWCLCSFCPRLIVLAHHTGGKRCLYCLARARRRRVASAAPRAAMQPVDEWVESRKAGDEIREANDHAIATGMVLTYANQVRQHQPPTMWDWVKDRVFGIPMPQLPAPAQLPPAAVPHAQGHQQHVQPGLPPAGQPGNVGQPLAAGNHGAPAR